MMQQLRNRRQSGDTIIEVTMALSILAVVLTSAFVAANRAYIIGQNARERTEMINLAQAQAEQLKSFRDTNDWAAFTAKTSGPGATSTDCPTGVYSCFQMVAVSGGGGTTKWEPSPGKMAALSSNGSIAITGTAGPTSADFKIVYSLNLRGSSVPATNRIPIKLANLEGIVAP